MLARPASAIGEASTFVPAIGKHGGNWNARAAGLKQLAWEITSRTSVETLPTSRPIDLADPALFSNPFLYLGSDSPLPPLREAEVANLRRFLTYGGFVVAEANEPSDEVDASFRRELGRVLPHNELTRLPQEHVIYKSFYLLDHPSGRIQETPYLEHLKVGKRAALVYSRNDMAGAWSRDDRGDWDFECNPGGAAQREYALRTGVNLALYALCLDYKEDAVHLKYIMQRRR